MVNSSLTFSQKINQKLSKIIKEVELEQENPSLLEEETLQKSLEVLIKAYVTQIQKDKEDFDHPINLRPLTTNHQLTQTETVLFVDELLKIMDIEIFELQMWRSMK